jgi:hypothetical protein
MVELYHFGQLEWYTDAVSFQLSESSCPQVLFEV